MQNLSANKRVVEEYLEGFRRGDHSMILDCLADDVEWEIPGMYHRVGKEEFDKEIESECFIGRPAIESTRLTEENDVVIAEGAVRTERREGGFVLLKFCDVFEMENGKIAKLISYLMEVK
jgi:ketosteroid isomerase-like protein